MKNKHTLGVSLSLTKQLINMFVYHFYDAGQ